MLEVEVTDEDDLSGIGDTFVNLIYSLALSNTLKRPVGKRASNLVLKEALLRSTVRSKAGTRLKRQEMGDFVESELFRAWLKGHISIEECVGVLGEAMRKEEEVREASIRAFAELLDEVERRIEGG